MHRSHRQVGFLLGKLTDGQLAGFAKDAEIQTQGRVTAAVEARVATGTQHQGVPIAEVASEMYQVFTVLL